MGNLPDNPNRTISPFDRVYAAGATPQKKSNPFSPEIREIVAASAIAREATVIGNSDTEDTDDLQLSANSTNEIQYRTFMKEINRAKELARLWEVLMDRNLTPEKIPFMIEADRKIIEMIGESVTAEQENRRMKEVMSRGIRALEMLLRKGQIEFRNKDSIHTLLTWKNTFRNPWYVINENDFPELEKLFNDIQPVIPRI